MPQQRHVLLRVQFPLQRVLLTWGSCATPKITTMYKISCTLSHPVVSPTGFVQPQVPGDLLDGLLVQLIGVGAPVDVLVGPPEADKVGGDDAVAARGEQGDDAVEGLRPERLPVQADDHLEGKKVEMSRNGKKCCYRLLIAPLARQNAKCLSG